MSIDTLREQRNRLVTEMQTLATKEGATSEDRAKFDTMVAEEATLRGDIERIETADRLAASLRSTQRPPIANPGAPVSTGDTRASKEYSAAFRSYVTTGEFRVNGPTGLSVGTSANGGVLVPTDFQRELESAMLAVGGALGAIRQISSSNGDPLQWPLSNDTSNYSQVVAEAVQAAISLPSYSLITLTPDQFSTGVVPMTRQLMQDSAIDVVSYVNEAMAMRMVRGLNKAITNGTTNVQGLLGSGVIAAGAVVTALGTGSTTAPKVGDITYKDILNLYGKLDPAYRPSAKFMMTNATWVYLLGVTDSYGRPLLQPDLNGKPFSTILGQEIVMNQDMPVVAASAISILFGDFSKYVLRNCGPVEVKRLDELYALSGQTAFLGWHRQAGALFDAGTHPVVALKQQAS